MAQAWVQGWQVVAPEWVLAEQAVALVRCGWRSCWDRCGCGWCWHGCGCRRGCRWLWRGFRRGCGCDWGRIGCRGRSFGRRWGGDGLGAGVPHARERARRDRMVRISKSARGHCALYLESLGVLEGYAAVIAGDALLRWCACLFWPVVRWLL